MFAHPHILGISKSFYSTLLKSYVNEADPSIVSCLISFMSKSGFVTDEEVKQRESKLRQALKSDGKFRVKEGASVEVAQVRSRMDHL